MAKKITREITLTHYQADELEISIVNLIEAAKKAALSAYAPYSNFQVGAALLLDTGEVIIGNNQENACFPAGLCAERVAFFAAKSQSPTSEILKVAIVAKPRSEDNFKMATPCGSCRQVMSEYENNQQHKIEIFLPHSDGSVYAAESLDTFLPFKFSNTDLSS